jgi:hypothetical protein
VSGVKKGFEEAVMNVKQPLRLAVLLVAVLATWAFAGIYYEQDMKTPAQAGMAPQGHKMVCYISGAKMRVEMQVPTGNVISIWRFDQSKMYNLMPDNKMYMEMPIPKPSPEVEAKAQATVTKTDETKKIGNYNCTRYDVTMKGLPGMPAEGVTSQYWMTTDVDVADEWAKFSETQGRSQSVKLFTDMANLKGFPILMEVNTPAGKMTMTVTTVKKQDVPDSMFEIPADYTNMAAPPAAPPAGGGGAEKAQ